jgi:hypothetical protein
MPAIPAHPTRAMLSLTSKVPLRLPVLRNGRNLNTARPSNLEALYGQYVGQVNVPGCTHCAGGFGMWTECVSVSGHFGGSCANCHYGSEGARCYLRKPPQHNLLTVTDTYGL